jgi:hypothetical protein
VTASDLRRNAVRPAKIAPKAVVAGKLGANSVLPGNLGNGIISTAKLADSAVIASKIKNGAITTNKLDGEAVTTPKLAKDSVTTAKLTPGSVTNPILANGSVTPNKLSNNFDPILGTLKSGQVLRGVFDLGSTADAAAELSRSSVSLQFPLAKAPAVTVLKKGETSANCGGLGTEAPLATAGHLCVYVTESKNLDPATPLAVENNTRLGFGLVAKSELLGEYYAYGQWAVTAP